MAGSPVGLQQLLRTQGIEWGDSGRGGGDFHLWFDGGTIYTDAVWSPQVGTAAMIPDVVGNGSTITQTQTALTTGFNAALYITKNYTPSASGNSSQALSVDMVTTGNGALVTGPSVAAVEIRHLWSATGIAGSTILYGGESLFSQDGTGTIGHATGWQSNIRGTGAGTVTSYSCFRSSPGPFTASGTSLIGYETGLDLSGTGSWPTVIGYDSRAIVKGTNDGTNLTGGLTVVGFIASVPNQGSNTSGSNNNWAYRVSNNTGHGGTVNNYVLEGALPDAAGAGGATGHTRNIFIKITGDGGTGATGNGGVTNWALFSQSLAQSGFAGPVGIGAVVSSALIDTGLAANTTLTVKPQIATSGSPTGILYTGAAHTTLANAETPDVNINGARTVQFTGSTTLATQRFFILQPPTYSSDTATKTITGAATFAVNGPPVAGTNAAITWPMTVWIDNSSVAVAGGGLNTPIAFGTTGGGVPAMTIRWGSGAPTIAAPQGSLYLRTDGSSTSTRLYVNTNGTTGWAAITTVA
jgi:hypothetical protein